MTIRLITGTPGSGKSLCLVDEACKLRDKEPERPMFAVGIDGLRGDVATSMESVKDWKQWPDGSIVLVDEAWRHFPPHSANQQPPDWIAELAEHRHRGFDFILATQHPTQISHFVRKLCGDHTHLVRKFGTHVVQRIRWETPRTDVVGQASIKQGQVTVWRFPKHRFKLYESASMHTVKRRVPKRVYIAAGLFLLLPILGWMGWTKLHAVSHEDVAVPASSPDSGGIAGTKTGQPVRMTAAEWAAQRLPRVAGVPWSAPMWDDLETTTVPDLQCIEIETENRQGVECHCFTEQGTPLNQVPDRVCRQAAEHGVYNPYRPAMERPELAESQTAHAGQDSAGRGRSASYVAGQGAGGWPASSMRQPYTPPQQVQGPAIHTMTSDFGAEGSGSGGGSTR